MIVTAVLITAFGLTAIYSTGVAKGDFTNFQKQTIFFVAGLCAMVAISFFDYRIFRNNSYLIVTLYVICLLLLLGTFFLSPTIRGTNRWYRIGPLSLDPIEPAKIVLIILLAKYFSMRHMELYKLRHILISGVYVALMAGLVFLRPNLGGAIILTLVWIGILMVSGIKLKPFLVIALSFVVIAAFSWQFLLHDYQKGRVIAFLFPTDVLGSAWSQTQTKIAIGSGKIFGQGLAQGSQVQYGFLPEPHTDFVFSVIAQEWGLVGLFVFFSLYALLIWRILKMAVESELNFPRLFCVGIAVVFIVQFTINVGMNLGLLPVVGIYLPLVSYGGSGLIANYIALGIVQSMYVRKSANY